MAHLFLHFHTTLRVLQIQKADLWWGRLCKCWNRSWLLWIILIMSERAVNSFKNINKKIIKQQPHYSCYIILAVTEKHVKLPELIVMINRAFYRTMLYQCWDRMQISLSVSTSLTWQAEILCSEASWHFHTSQQSLLIDVVNWWMQRR